MLKNALGFTAVAASVKKLGDAVYGCFSDFEEADRKYRQLEIALGGGEAFDKVSGTISVLSLIPLITYDNNPMETTTNTKDTDMLSKRILYDLFTVLFFSFM